MLRRERGMVSGEGERSFGERGMVVRQRRAESRERGIRKIPRRESIA
ncbi:MAG TPA: hypothetical protein VK899_00590 [Gemmatimonadales bacterium]|nr:hypothetical protein [Gemmatimonadales bacterium]